MKKKYYIYIIYLIIVSLIVTGVTFSRYSTSVSSLSSVSVAKPVIEYVPVSATLNGVVIEDLTGGISLLDVMPGDELIYTFEIRNFEGTAPDIFINQVLMRYRISLIFDPSEENLNLPLTYDLSGPDPAPEGADGWTYMGFGEQITHSYTLTVTWDINETDSAYTEKTQSIKVEVEAEQTLGA